MKYFSSQQNSSRNQRMFKPKTTIAGRLENSSGEWIRTTDLRVMRDFPGFGTFFTQAPHFSLA